MPGPYAAILRDRSLRHLLIEQLLARSPSGMMVLAFTLFVTEAYDSIGATGTTIGCYTLGACVAGPLTSRLAASIDARIVVGVLAVAWSSMLVVLALIDQLPRAGLFALAGLLGLLLPPVAPTVRALYPALVTRERVGPLIALDASIAETMWVFGPVVVAVAHSLWGSRTALVLVAAIALLGVLLVISNPHFRPLPGRPRTDGMLAALRRRRLWVLMAATASLMAGWGSLEIAMSDRLNSGALLGTLFASMAVAGTISGIWCGRRPLRRWSMSVRASCVATGILVAAIVPGPWLAIAALTCAGAGSAPTLSAIFTYVTGSVGPRQVTVAYGWITTAQLAGTSLGAIACGWIVEGAGHWAFGMVLAAGCFALCAVVGALNSAVRPPATPTPAQSASTSEPADPGSASPRPATAPPP